MRNWINVFGEEMIEVKGKAGIVARVVADSISEAGVRLTTFEIEYPRMILAELNTHRMLSKNSASSRAIPFVKMVEQLTAKPVRFGQANAGMQDKGEDYDSPVDFKDIIYTSNEAWAMAKDNAVFAAGAFYAAGYHKQVYNRLVEPFQMMKTVISGTEWDNFFWLRDDAAADPTIAELARCMRAAREQSVPEKLFDGEYHLPYIDIWYDDHASPRIRGYSIGDEYGNPKTLNSEQAIKVSCARCAAVSYRGVDYGLEKCLQLYDRLVGSEKKHSSALEHCATPMKAAVIYKDFGNTYGVNVPALPDTWQEGVSHTDREGNLWSGNLKGFIQHRKTIVGENYINQESE